MKRPLAVAALSVLAVAFAGCGQAADSTSSSSAEPSATAPPTPTATGPQSLIEAPTSGNLAAGEYYLDLPVYPARIDFEVPDGWWHFSELDSRADSTVHALLVDSLDTGAANGSAWGVGFTVVTDVRVDPCDRTAGNMDAAVTESADSLADAFSAWPGFPATGVEDVTISGFSGKRVEITHDEGACDEPALFTTPSSYEFGPSSRAASPWSTSSRSWTSRARSW